MSPTEILCAAKDLLARNERAMLAACLCDVSTHPRGAEPLEETLTIVAFVADGQTAGDPYTRLVAWQAAKNHTEVLDLLDAAMVIAAAE